MTARVETWLKWLSLAFTFGVTYAGVQNQVNDKVDQQPYSVDSTFVHEKLRQLDATLVSELIKISAQLQVANSRLREICIKTRSGC